jgi:hypothetical protein
MREKKTLEQIEQTGYNIFEWEEEKTYRLGSRKKEEEKEKRRSLEKKGRGAGR